MNLESFEYNYRKYLVKISWKKIYKRIHKDVDPNLTAQSKKRPLTKCGLSAKVCKIILQCVKLGRNFAKLSLEKKNLHFEQGCRDFNSELSRPSFSKGNQHTHTHSKEPFQAAKAQSRFKVTKTLFLKKSRHWCSYKIFTQIIEIDENMYDWSSSNSIGLLICSWN